MRRVEIRSAHRYRFPAPREAVWAAFADVRSYPDWWPWLRRFDARALAVGDAWRCTIRPPLPYALHITIALAVVEHPSLVTAHVTGDISGEAHVALAPASSAAPTAPTGETDGTDGTDVEVASALSATSLAARVGSRALPPLARWGHDWVFRTAARQFGEAHGWPPVPAPAPQRTPMNNSRMPRPMMNRPPSP